MKQKSDLSAVIFQNEMEKKVIKKGEQKKQAFIKKFGDDSDSVYAIGIEENS